MSLFRTDVRTLKAALSKVLPVVERRVTVPILGHVRLSVSKGVLTVSGTDLDMQIDAAAPVVADVEMASTTEPRALLAVLGALSDDEALTVAMSGPVHIDITWSGGRLHCPAFPASDFPDIRPTGPQVNATFDDAVSRALVRALPFVSTEETRYYLNGVCLLQSDGRGVIAATDGRRLVVMPGGPTLDALAKEMAGAKAIIPRKAARLWSDLFPVGHVDAALYQRAPGGNGASITNAEFSADGVRLITKTIDGSYPPFERVIPAPDQPNQLTLLRADLLRACAVAESTGKDRGVFLRAEAGRAQLLAQNFDGSAVVLDLGATGATWGVAVQTAFLVSTVEAVQGEHITLSGNGATWPVLVCGDETPTGEAVVFMPMNERAPDVAPVKAAA